MTLKLHEKLDSYLMAAGLAIAAVFLQLFLNIWLGNLRFMLFFPVMFFASWRGGLGPGIFASIFTAALAYLFFTDDTQVDSSFGLRTILTFTTYISIGVITSLLNERAQNFERAQLRALAEVERERARFKESEARLQLALNAARMNLWELQLENMQFWRSDRHDQLFGLPQNLSSLDFTQFLDFVHPEDRTKVRDGFDSTARKNSPLELEYRLLSGNQSVRWVSSIGQLILDPTGRPLHIAGCTFDITERKQVESDLRDALLARDEFLSIASHELKTPLTALSFSVQLLKRAALKEQGDQLSPNIRSRIDLSDRQVRQLTRLVEELLDVSRIRSKKLSYNMQESDLVEIVKSALENFREECRLRNVELNIELPESAIGIWDQPRLEQVVGNLISNAIKYGDGSPITIKLSHFEDGFLLIVRDEGQGISNGDRERIFGRFERAVSPKHFGGLGLGLYIVHQIVTAHQGAVWVESQKGAGTSFFVNLPKASKQEPSDPKAAANIVNA